MVSLLPTKPQPTCSWFLLIIPKSSRQPMHSPSISATPPLHFFSYIPFFNAWAHPQSQENNTYCWWMEPWSISIYEGRTLPSSRSSQSHLFLLFLPIYPATASTNKLPLQHPTRTLSGACSPSHPSLCHRPSS